MYNGHLSGFPDPILPHNGEYNLYLFLYATVTNKAGILRRPPANLATTAIVYDGYPPGFPGPTS